MTLPQFTGGSVGKLTFSHLHEAFDAIDGLDRDAGSAAPNMRNRGRVILARVTGIVSGKVAWVEIQRAGTQFQTVVNGRSSIEGSNIVAYPIFGFGSVQPTVGSDVAIFPAYDSTGALYYVPVAAASSSSSFMGRVGANPATIVQDVRWRYSVTEVEWNGGGYSAVSGGLTVNAYNGCENPTDDQANVGIGQPRGPTQTMTRQPIKSGTVAVVVRDASGNYSFSLPNGYAFTCAP